MRDSNVRPFRDGDEVELNRWKKSDPAVLLETPHGFMGTHTETAVVEKDGEKILSLTASIAAVLDPLIRNPNASRLDIMEGLFKAEAALAFVAAKTGALDLYISVPDEQVAYQNILKRVGYTPILQGCTVFKKPLVAPVPQEPEKTDNIEVEPAPDILLADEPTEVEVAIEE